MKNRFVFYSCVLGMALLCSCANAPVPFGPVPSKSQLEWQKMERYAFIHFSINTFTNQEWGNGGESAELFNPEQLDCRQWARVCKEAGMKGIIITAKHHAGFCLWPSAYTEYSVKNSPWKDGKGDVIKELAEACKEYDLKLGIYLSPWDRNRADYGQPSYIEYFRNQLTELLTGYGPIFEVWFDGANGGDGYYGGAWENRHIDRATYYDWPNTIALIRKLQPNAVIWNEVGPDVRWCGNEQGAGNRTNWSRYSYADHVPGQPNNRSLSQGEPDGTDFVVSEINVSSRPGWFYHEIEDSKVKSLPHLLDIYYNSVGCNGTWLLNFPIMPNGLIHDNDAAAAKRLNQELNEIFKEDLALGAIASASVERGPLYNASMANDCNPRTYWAAPDTVTQAQITLSFSKPIAINRILLQEHIELGQRISKFSVDAHIDGEWVRIANETTIGYKRILRFETYNARAVRVNIEQSRACPTIESIGLYCAPQVLVEPAIMRNKNGQITIKSTDAESLVYYTTDGSNPTVSSNLYTAPFVITGKVTVKAMAYDNVLKKSGPVATENFDVARAAWKVIYPQTRDNELMFDGNPGTNFMQYGVGHPAYFAIDLGKTLKLCGFRYLPDQANYLVRGIVNHYEFYTSMDGKNWSLASKGQFSNIKNNPLWQTVTFAPVQARFVKLVGLDDTNGWQDFGCAEFDVVTGKK